MTLRAVLAGAGHAHLQLIANADALRRSGVAPVLISPAVFRYSGLASGVLSGAVEPEEAEIDVAALARHHGVEHRIGEIETVDLHNRTISAAGGATLAFDAVSFNVGSEVRTPAALDGVAGIWPVKPLAGLLALRRHLEAVFAAERRCPALVVAGRGQTGYEIAAALAGLCERHGIAPRLTLAGPAESVQWAPRAAVARLETLLARRGIAIVSDGVADIADGRCRLASGRTLTCDALVLATGLAAPPLIASLGLPVDDRGRLLTMPMLNAAADPRVFGAGDCATIEAAPRPFAGVFGVRSAGILAGNLSALAQGGPLGSYRPQASWLAIMDLGDGTGLAMRGGRWWLGRPALALKRWIDRRFIARYRRRGGGP